MRFCVVTLSFNQGQFVYEAIESILKQQADIDYLVYDAGSKDNSREIIDSFQDLKIHPHYVNGDKGPADGLNVGLQLTSGEIFYYLNADDRVLPGAFSFVEEYFSKHPECDILHGSINLINSNGDQFRILPSMKFSLRGYALGYSVIYQQATFIRKSVLRDLPFNIENRISWDGELIVDLALAGAVIHQTQTILGDFRIYSESITGSRRFLTLAKEEHSRIAQKIIGHEIMLWEKLLGASIRYTRAMNRIVLPRYSILK